MEQTLPKLKTNLDTNLLKLVAVVCMLLDHFGGTFFEQVPAFRWRAGWRSRCSATV